ncbi:MAG: ribulose-phosphate 3-epimerase [Candidatus Kapabacteria bacterium]|nr:ribulose-phosphate 3-epimerase [Ignavibacteriota bacterium]MCW5884767.1 ribulose-phosphate 3-epimerase [Candidatus Kapabacteria bacterium]
MQNQTLRKPIKIAPSLLSANFAELGSDVRKCDIAGADIIHLDIMDGHFVPNITFGPQIVKSIRGYTQLPFDVHLMIEDADKYIPGFIDAGADMISVHVEASRHLHRSLSLIKSFGKQAGIVLNPVSPLEYAYDAAEYCDFILLMSVNPGFGGQSFIPSFLNKCDKLANYLDNNGLNHIEIEVDGGVKADNIASVASAGANIIVSGSGVFKGDIGKNIMELKINSQV